MATTAVPRSAHFVFDVARDALLEQLGRIDSLDSKAGILLAADGILAGLVFGRQVLASDAPAGIGLVAGFFLLASLACSVIAFANRSYETAPRADEIAPFGAASEDWIRWNFIGNVLGAIAANRNTLARKARWLTAGQILLLVSLAPLGGYFVYDSIGKVI